MRKTKNEQNQNSSKEKKLSERQTAILDLKNTMTEVKSSMESFNRRLNQAEEKNW